MSLFIDLLYFIKSYHLPSILPKLYTLPVTHIYVVLDLKNYLVKTLTGLKYHINGLELLIQSIHLSVKKKILDSNLFSGKCSITLNEDSLIDMDSFFPIKSEDELMGFETSISDSAIHCMLVVYIFNIQKYLFYLVILYLLEINIKP
jgi:hypothetical protein